MEPISTGIGLALGLAGAVGGLFGAKKANKQINNLMHGMPVYAESPIAKQRLGLATTLFNARMPGATVAERNILNNASDAYSNVQRNATDSATALALASGVQGQADQAVQDLAMKEAEDYQRRYGNVVGAQEGMIQEGDKVFQNKVQNYQNQVSLTGAKIQNTANAWQSLSNFGYGVASLGMSGGFGGGAGTPTGGRLQGNVLGNPTPGGPVFV